MHIHQISVFLENRVGQLAEITSLLANEHVDIRAISIAETADYGLARLIVDDSHKASSILQNGLNVVGRHSTVFNLSKSHSNNSKKEKHKVYSI